MRLLCLNWFKCFVFWLKTFVINRSWLFSFQLRKSFKDLKKKFNNLKFNYMKKNDKSRNLKAVKNQIQQIEIYVEKLQVRHTLFATTTKSHFPHSLLFNGFEIIPRSCIFCLPLSILILSLFLSWSRYCRNGCRYLQSKWLPAQRSI